MSYAQLKDYESIFSRLEGLFKMLKNFPDWMSDEEIEGALRFLAPDPGNMIEAGFAPHTRKASLAFLRLMLDWFYGIIEAKESGKKIIMIPFNCPPEIFFCFENAYPVTSEVLSQLAVSALWGQGDRYWDIAMSQGFPDSLCSSAVIALGSILSGVDPLPIDAVVSTAVGGCDANAKTHEYIARFLGIPQFILERPADESKLARETHLLTFQRLLRDLEEFLGEELREERMRGVLEMANRSAEVYLDIWQLRRLKPCPCPNLFSLLFYCVRFTLWGKDKALDVMRVMLETVKERRARGEYEAPEEVARLFWIYTLYYFDIKNFFRWMDKKGIVICGDILGSFFLNITDTSSKESMVRGLAQTVWDYSMTRQMAGGSIHGKWLDDIVYWITEQQADAAVYSGHLGCKQSWSVFSITRKEIMKRLQVPTLMLQGDSWRKSITPISAVQEQIEEFVDVVLRKKSTV